MSAKRNVPREIPHPHEQQCIDLKDVEEMDMSDGLIFDVESYSFYSAKFLQRVARALCMTVKEVKYFDEDAFYDRHPSSVIGQNYETVYIIAKSDVFDREKGMSEHYKTINCIRGSLHAKCEGWCNGYLRRRYSFPHPNVFGREEHFSVDGKLVFKQSFQTVNDKVLFMGIEESWKQDEEGKWVGVRYYFLFDDIVEKRVWMEYENGITSLLVSFTPLPKDVLGIIGAYTTF